MISALMPAARSDNRKAAVLPTCSIVTLRCNGALASTQSSIFEKSWMPLAASVLIGPAEIPLTRMPRAKRCRQIAHARLKRGFGQAHRIVVRDHLLSAQIAQRQQRSVRTERRPRRFGERWKAVGGNIVRDAEILARQAIQKIARNRFARRKTDGMDQTLQAIPVFLQFRECALDLRVVGYITFKNQRAAKGVREFCHARPEPLARVSEGQFRTFAPARARNAIGDRTVRQKTRQ